MPNATLAERLLRQVEPLAALSTLHLAPQTRQRLWDGTLSVPAYSNDYGGFVHVGECADIVPAEPDLAVIRALARQAGLAWLKFDADAGVVDGLATYAEAEAGVSA
ncbi:MAG: hypothetical protein WAQ05_09870 [Rubrivivax sp.]|jgi:hypothetical protein